MLVPEVNNEQALKFSATACNCRRASNFCVVCYGQHRRDIFDKTPQLLVHADVCGSCLSRRQAQARESLLTNWHISAGRRRRLGPVPLVI